MPDADKTQQNERASTERVRFALAAAVTAGFLGVMLLFAFRAYPEGSEEVLLILIGILAKMQSDVSAYYFGSSSGSARKQDDLTRLASQAVPDEPRGQGGPKPAPLPDDYTRRLEERLGYREAPASAPPDA